MWYLVGIAVWDPNFLSAGGDGGASRDVVSNLTYVSAWVMMVPVGMLSAILTCVGKGNDGTAGMLVELPTLCL